MEQNHPESENNNSFEVKHIWKRLLTTPEGRILEIGLILALLFITVLGIAYLRIPEKAHVFIGMSATNILFGRAAGISFGYAVGLSNIFVITTNIFVETILVLIFYPLFVFSWQSLLVIKVLDNFMERISTAAELHSSTIRKYGMVGLFFLVWLPFWMTGPMVGCAVGYILGLRPWLNMTIVLSSTCLAIFSWAILLREIHEMVAEYNPYAPLILVIIIIFVVLGIYVLQYLRHKY